MAPSSPFNRHDGTGHVNKHVREHIDVRRIEETLCQTVADGFDLYIQGMLLVAFPDLLLVHLDRLVVLVVTKRECRHRLKTMMPDFRLSYFEEVLWPQYVRYMRQWLRTRDPALSVRYASYCTTTTTTTTTEDGFTLIEQSEQALRTILMFPPPPPLSSGHVPDAAVRPYNDLVPFLHPSLVARYKLNRLWVDDAPLTPNSFADRVCGMLFAHVCGDAMQTVSPDRRRLRILDHVGAYGQTTHATTCALALLNLLIRHGGRYNRRAALSCYLRHADTAALITDRTAHYLFAGSGGSRAVYAKRKHELRSNGTYTYHQSTCALNRSPPLALIADSVARRRAVAEDCRLTNPYTECIAINRSYITLLRRALLDADLLPSFVQSDDHADSVHVVAVLTCVVVDETILSNNDALYALWVAVESATQFPDDPGTAMQYILERSPCSHAAAMALLGAQYGLCRLLTECRSFKTQLLAALESNPVCGDLCTGGPRTEPMHYFTLLDRWFAKFAPRIPSAFTFSSSSEEEEEERDDDDDDTDPLLVFTGTGGGRDTK